MPTEPIRSEPVNLFQLFNDHPRLRVPEFQRTYVWSTKSNKELPMFWSDLTSRWNGEVTTPLFLGAVVWHETSSSSAQHPGKYDIIDGQQRLITLYLLLAAIAEAYLDAAEPGKAKDITAGCLLHQRSEYKNWPHIIPATHDSNQFNSIMLQLGNLEDSAPRIDSKGHGDADGLLTEAWHWLRSKVRRYAADSESETGLSVHLLGQLQSKLFKHTHLVTIKVFDKTTAHQVFERLNTGGKRLDHIDLVRNMVFSTLAADSSETGANFYNTHWDPFEESLGDRAADFWYPLALIRDPRSTTDGAYTSLQHHWLSNSFTRGSTGKSLAERIMDDLREFQDPFREMTGLAKPSSLDADSALAVRRLRRAIVPAMTYSFFIPLIKARLTGEIEAKQFILFCEIVEAAIARRVLEGRETNAFQSSFKGLSWNDLSGEALLDHLSKKLKLATDDELRHGILTQNLYAKKRRQYVLTEYERWQKDGERLDPTDKKRFQVDRVLPLKYNPIDWPNVSRDEHQVLVHTWGNLMLLTPEMNRVKSAAEYEQARPELAKPGGVPFRSTGMLVSRYTTWSAVAIRERGEELADWAIRRWPSTIEGFMDPERAKRLLQAK